MAPSSMVPGSTRVRNAASHFEAVVSVVPQEVRIASQLRQGPVLTATVDGASIGGLVGCVTGGA